MIAAASENDVIGKDNALVWNLPTDTAYFKKTTLHHTIIMGRKTFDSMGKPLPKRRNLIVTRNKDFKAPGAEVFLSLPEAIRACDPAAENFIIGGGELYREGLEFADRIYLTRVHTHVSGDSHFPRLDPILWKEMSRDERKADPENSLDFTFLVFERVHNPVE
jgi:dihydrofolate reductase